MNAATIVTAKKKRARTIVRMLKKMYPHVPPFLHYTNAWELLVAVVLSAQCTDKKVNEVTGRLFRKYRTLRAYARAPQAAFARDIYATGFYRSKAKHILRAAKLVEQHFKGKVPRTMEELLTIPGVGRKTANIILESAFGKVEGIAVDTHVKRLARVWKLSGAADPEHIERDLMALIPEKEWPELSRRIIRYGREWCPAKRHNHEECPMTKCGL
jgi:endonuclease-3